LTAQLLHVQQSAGQIDTPLVDDPRSSVFMTASTDRSAWNHGLIEDYRANGKATSGPFVGRQLLLLTTKGAKSGAERTAPLVYTTDGDKIVIVASMGGAPTHPHWFANVVANPVVTVELGQEKFRARATVADAAERRRLYDAHADLHPSFVDYEQNTTREIPVVLLERLNSAAG
jgi:deazaflavin-dependent oxidoreductase (nitroreductase family)